MTMQINPIDKDKLWKMIQVAKGERPATTWITGGTVLNVYTGELEAADIVTFEDRIVYVGIRRPNVNVKTKVIDAKGFTLVPGYIEPHAHPFQLYTVKTLGEFALSLGTTTLVNDNLLYYLNLEEVDIQYLIDYSSKLPVKNFWWARLDPQSNHPEMLKKFTTNRLKHLLHQERVLQAGELTSWPAALKGDETILEAIAETRKLGKRIEGHSPGASVDTLNTLATLGVTADHEAINGEEVIRRLRLGIYVTMRHSSIRPDLPEIIKGLQAVDFDFSSANRLMLTTDGSMPHFLKHGFIDYLIKVALEHGVPAPAAYRMATLNPAVYFGLDQEIGGIAPGKIADILFLKNLTNPTPIHVMVDGEIAVEHGKLLQSFPDCNWDRLNVEPMNREIEVRAEWLDMKSNSSKIPVIELVNAVITKTTVGEFNLDNGIVQIGNRKGYCYISLIDKNGKWATNGIIKGFANQVDAIATTYTASQDIIVIGQNKEVMANAVNQLTKLGGGTILMEGEDTVFELKLSHSGKMSSLSIHELIPQTTELFRLLEERGHIFSDPFYTLFFLTSTHLPSIRLTAEGLYSVKENLTIYPVQQIS